MSATDQTAASLFRSGKLTEAVAAAQAALRKAPTDLSARVLLAELLCFSGNLERADVILDAASTIDPSSAVVVAEFRQLVRADMARRQLFRDGRVPEFLGEPTETQRLQLAALVALRAGDMAEAATQAAAAEAARPHCPGKHNDTVFDDLRDVDDLLAGTLEVLTTTGKYYWVPTERLISATFHPPKRPRDLLWRRASVSVDAGPDGDVYVPVTYAGDDTATEAQRLGHETDWQQAEGGPVRGVGQRVFLLGEDDVAVMELGELTFTNVGGA
ncbi:MAG TPA: type VI secretion system accessory protein TagJ [Acetobacteraceae bacterium]|nr:type VI secretion system accessory protein TagJ [Caulobacteraceae bacterium]HUB16925.1 type VI secretion system accessory protein TagJ [Acetobacteraceae bacterium]